MVPDALVVYVGAPVALALVAVLAAYLRRRRRSGRPAAKAVGSGHDRSQNGRTEAER
jgi:hypothetical protein